MNRTTNQQFFIKILSLIVLLFFSLISVYPVLNVLSISLRPVDAFQSRSLSIVNSQSSFINFITLFKETSFLTWLKNSIIVSSCVTLFGMTLAATSGYALARYNFKGKRWAMLSLVATQMFPASMLLLPFFIVLSQLQLINNFWGLFIIYSATALPFCIWQMKAYYDTIPKELEEAALLDGCSPFQAFYKIILPLSLPALAITALFNFMSAWSEYAVAAVVLQDPELYTLPLGLKSFQASLATQWGLYAAGSLVVSIPIVALFLFLSRYLISGLTLGGVKG